MPPAAAAGGGVFAPVDVVPAEASEQITFTRRGGSYALTGKAEGMRGALTIVQDGSVISGEAAVGIATSGDLAFAVPAEPHQTASFPAVPEYWIAFGKFSPGQLLGDDVLGAAQTIEFPDGVFTIAATLNSDHSWTIAPVRQIAFTLPVGVRDADGVLHRDGTMLIHDGASSRPPHDPRHGVPSYMYLIILGRSIQKLRSLPFADPDALRDLVPEDRDHLQRVAAEARA